MTRGLPLTTLVPAITLATTSPEAPDATCGKRVVKGLELGSSIFLGERGNTKASRHGHCCHLVGKACYFSWFLTPGLSLAEHQRNGLGMGEMPVPLNLGSQGQRSLIE